MLVWELIKVLQKLSDNLEVVYIDEDGYEEIIHATKIDVEGQKPFILLV